MCVCVCVCVCVCACVCVVYEANISTKVDKFNVKTYIGISSQKWKFRYYKHKQSFNNSLLRNQTDLSKSYWKLKNHGLTLIINWKILKNVLFNK